MGGQGGQLLSFARSVNPISTRGGRLCPPTVLLTHPAIFSANCGLFPIYEEKTRLIDWKICQIVKFLNWKLLQTSAAHSY